MQPNDSRNRTLKRNHFLQTSSTATYHIVSSGTQTGSYATNLSLNTWEVVLDNYTTSEP